MPQLKTLLCHQLHLLPGVALQVSSNLVLDMGSRFNPKNWRENLKRKSEEQMPDSCRCMYSTGYAVNGSVVVVVGIQAWWMNPPARGDLIRRQGPLYYTKVCVVSPSQRPGHGAQATVQYHSTMSIFSYCRDMFNHMIGRDSRSRPNSPDQVVVIPSEKSRNPFSNCPFISKDR